MGHDADDGLPRGHLLSAHFAFDILQRNEPMMHAAERQFSNRYFELQCSGWALHAQDRGASGADGFHADSERLAVPRELYRLSERASKQPPRRHIEQLHPAAFVRRDQGHRDMSDDSLKIAGLLFAF